MSNTPLHHINHLMKQHGPALEKLMRHFTEEPNGEEVDRTRWPIKGARGQFDEIKYRVTQNIGQRVLLLDLIFPDGTLVPVALRPVRNEKRYAEFHENFKSVQKHFPDMYKAVKLQDGKMTAVMSERIFGISAKTSTNQQVEDFLNKPGRLEQRTKALIEIINDLADDGFYIEDIRLWGLQNVFYNKKKNQFHMIDIDSLRRPSEKKPYNKEFLIMQSLASILQDKWSSRQIDDRRLKLMFDIIQTFKKEHRDIDFRCTNTLPGFKYMSARYIPDALMPSGPDRVKTREEFGEEARDIDKVYALEDRDDKDILVKGDPTWTITREFGIYDEILEVCDESVNDFERFKELKAEFIDKMKRSGAAKDFLRNNTLGGLMYDSMVLPNEEKHRPQLEFNLEDRKKSFF